MNGIEEIINRIKEDSKLEEQEKRNENAQEIKKILDEAGEKIEKISNETLEIIEKETKVETSKLELKLSTLKRDIELTAKQDYVNSLYKRAAEKLATLDSEEYTSIFAPLLKEALSDPFIKDKTSIVVFPKNVKTSPEELLKKAGVKVDYTLSDNLSSGFIVKTDEVEIDCSGDKLVSQSKRSSEKKVIKTLFE